MGIALGSLATKGGHLYHNLYYTVGSRTTGQWVVIAALVHLAIMPAN